MSQIVPQKCKSVSNCVPKNEKVAQIVVQESKSATKCVKKIKSVTNCVPKRFGIEDYHNQTTFGNLFFPFTLNVYPFLVQSVEMAHHRNLRKIARREKYWSGG